MDTFTDKLAQKKNAQELILANMTAEAAKMEQMQNQMKAYDDLMQEIRQVNLKTAENLSDAQNMLKDYMTKLETMQADHSKTEEIEQTLVQLKAVLEEDSKNEKIKQTLAQLESILEDNSRNEAYMQALTQLRENLEEKLRQSDDFLHRENVKVYRNVQAAMTEELNRQTEELKNSQRENRGSKAVLPISIVTLIAVLIDVAIHIFEIISPYINI